ncbi:MAG: MFS transporter [Gammaproteobacteria bacterium]
MLIDYWRFARTHSRFLGFGFLLAFLSSPGQTYFIGVFGPEIQALFDLDNAAWGRTYMIGTLASAAVITWSGTFIDRIDLRLFATLSLAGLVCACLVIGSVSSPVMLVLAIFMLRQFGQGLTSHASITSMARYHATDRGKAIALAAIGFSFGEAFLPLLAVFSIQAWGWREAYFGTAALVLLSIPLALWLLKGHQQRHALLLENLNHTATEVDQQTSYTRSKMLSEPLFYLMLPAMIAPSMIGTAMFFFPAEIARAKGWSSLWVTGNYWVYSTATVLTIILSGVLIDRFSARKVVPYFLLPLAAGLAALTISDDRFMIWPYMFLTGISSGVYFTGLSALWAELYGPRYLGAIKSLTNAVMVFSSALGPALVGDLLTRGMELEQICLILVGFCMFATLMLFYALRKPRS